MKKNTEKPSPEAKALSLFLMAYKTIKPIYKDQSKRINRLWDLVVKKELSSSDYIEEVQKMLTLYGGYSEVVENWLPGQKTELIGHVINRSLNMADILSGRLCQMASGRACGCVVMVKSLISNWLPRKPFLRVPGIPQD